MMDILKEACVGSFQEARSADKLGADRIELCDNLAVGGTTPSFGTIKMAKESLRAPIFPIIRPRGGDFIFNQEEIQIMETDIEACWSLNIEGVVIGVLNPDRTINESAVKRLVEKAKTMNISFHMAFDEIEDKKAAIDKLIELGISRVLTKGGPGRAIDNMVALKELIDYADGRIHILAGGSVTRENYMDIVKATGVREVHGTKIV